MTSSTRVASRLLFTLSLFAACALSQPPQFAHWTPQTDPPSAAPGGHALIRMPAKIDPGWHLYSASSPSGIPASFKLGQNNIVERVRVFQPKPHRAVNPIDNS